MKRRLRYIALLLPAATLLAATCVTSTQQRGPAGPWVGEVTNYGPEPAGGVAVRANIFDASGAYLGLTTVFTCPSTIMPGQRGSFETFFQLYSQPPPAMALPLRAEFEPIPLEQQMGVVTGDGLSTRLVSRDAAKRVVIVEVRNESAQTFWQTEVCANLRGPSGELLEVGSARLFPSVLRPGETQTVPIFFNSMPPGDFEFFARGQNVCCGSTLTFDPSQFKTEISRVFAGNLLVSGEMTNAAGQDLSGARVVAYIGGAPEMRTEAPLGCGGYVRLGEKAPAVFGIPLGASAPEQPRLVIVGIEAYPSTTGLNALPVSNIAFTRSPASAEGLKLTDVSATVTNSTSSWMGILVVCVTLRDASGRVVGAGGLTGDLSSLAPGAALTVKGQAADLGAAVTAEVQALGYLTQPPVACCGPID